MVSISRSAPLVAEKEEAIVRFDIHQRLQHLLMMGSFLVLAFTGLPQKFSDWPISQWWVSTLGGIDNVRQAHRIAAFVMVFDCLYHVGYILYNTLVFKKPLPVWMFPNLKDARDFFQDVRYFLGLSNREPKFGRFSYREKFDYWAIFWGVPIMAISGFVLMFPVLVTKVLPGTAVPIALVAHSDEALLAIGWIFIVHFYFSHLAPRVFPVNTSIFTGKLAKSRYQAEHPLEYEEKMAAPGGPAPQSSSSPSSPPGLFLSRDHVSEEIYPEERPSPPGPQGRGEGEEPRARFLEIIPPSTSGPSPEASAPAPRREEKL